MKSFVLAVFAIVGVLSAHTLTHYTAHSPLCDGSDAVIRSFTLDGTDMQLSVNVHTLQTSITPQVKAPRWSPCQDSNYTRLLSRAASAPYPLTNDGITCQSGKGIAVTTDLCPSSKKGFEKHLYETLIAHFKNPAPVTLFISGKWIRRHLAALRQFRQWEQQGKLAITWGNHTYAHPYHPGKPNRATFALTPGYDLRSDTLRLEKQLIEQGITPSVFFRFPGLVSNLEAIQTIHNLGLIPIGTDAWIAKGQTPHEGSIILLHGNRNEPKGVKVFLEMIEHKRIKHITPLHCVGRNR
jgi:peptidoglycan/xylan/chitin deacetylase (PgdA/CDA1 family)